MASSDDDESPPSVETLHIQRAASDRVSYIEPQVVHETTKKRVTVLPTFVDRTGGRTVHFKITTEERKKNNLGVTTWLFADKRELNLTEEAATQLSAFIRRTSELARKGSDGSFVTIRVTDGVADVASLDPATVTKAITGLLNKKEILAHLADQELGPELVKALKGAIRLREMNAAVANLRGMLKSGENDERRYQKWCESHSWAFGSAMLAPDKVRQIALGDQLDFLVPSTLTGLRDVIELKRPDMNVLGWDDTHKNYFWTADASKAIGQCHRYLDALHEAAESGLRDHPEIVAYHPRATIVIGRSNDWEEKKSRALHGLNARLSSIQVMTYDQLLAQAERVVESFVPEADSDDGPAEGIEEEVDDFPDDL